MYVCVYVRTYIHGHYFCPLIQDPLISVLVFPVKETEVKVVMEKYFSDIRHCTSKLSHQEKMLLCFDSLSSIVTKRCHWRFIDFFWFKYKEEISSQFPSSIK